MECEFITDVWIHVTGSRSLPPYQEYSDHASHLDYADHSDHIDYDDDVEGKILLAV